MEIKIDQLPEPAVPSSIERVVMARIAQMADAPPRSPAEAAERGRRARWSDTPAWVASIVGLALFIASWMAGHVNAGIMLAMQADPIAATAAFERMPLTAPSMIGLTIGAVLFVGGLFWRDREAYSSRSR